jgi:hypothetical protein
MNKIIDRQVKLYEMKSQQNECPKKDKDGNCVVPGTYSDSEPIGGG